MVLEGCPKGMAEGNTRRTIEDRFWSKVDRSNEDPEACWEWQASFSSSGYGRFWNGVKGDTLPHRISWVMANGPISPSIYVCHRCDNKKCVRPSHLFLGTQRDNMLDMVAKGRSCSRLSVDEIDQIYRSVGNNSEIGRRFGVSRTTVRDIRSGRVLGCFTGAKVAA